METEPRLKLGEGRGEVRRLPGSRCSVSSRTRGDLLVWNLIGQLLDVGGVFLVPLAFDPQWWNLKEVS